MVFLDVQIFFLVFILTVWNCAYWCDIVWKDNKKYLLVKLCQNPKVVAQFKFSPYSYKTDFIYRAHHFFIFIIISFFKYISTVVGNDVTANHPGWVGDSFVRKMNNFYDNLRANLGPFRSDFKLSDEKCNY